MALLTSWHRFHCTPSSRNGFKKPQTVINGSCDLRKDKQMKSKCSRYPFIVVYGVLFLTYIQENLAVAQDSTHIDATRLSVVGGVTAATVAVNHIYQRRAWWQGEREPFRFVNDWEYALNIDKFGHVYAACLTSNLARAALQWSGLNEKGSVFYGSVFGLAYELYVEAEDGFHKAYGFSPGDAISDIVGTMIPLAQATFPVLQNFSLKWSYYPSRQYLDELKSEKLRTFIDDYEGQVYWISVDPHFMMSERLSEIVPRWLGLSFGAAVHDLGEQTSSHRLYYLTMDYNFSKIETESSVVRTVLHALDFFHLPSPGIGLENGKLRAGIFYTYHVKLTL
jgi:hypothetical protein